MNMGRILLTCCLVIGSVNAEDIMKKSMSIMEQGMTQIQQGFLNNNVQLIRDGSKLVKDGNAMFTDKEIIAQYLPNDKKHMVNVAENAAKRIDLDVNVLELNLDDKAYINAANAYSDILNACARCHSIVRKW